MFQGGFSEYDEETGYNEFDLRHYDAQTGRWTTADPYQQFASPYLGMGNSPGGMADPDGGEVTNWYRKIGTSFIRFFPGTGEISGYENLGNAFSAWYNLGGGKIVWAHFMSDGSKMWALDEVVVPGRKYLDIPVAQVNLCFSCHGDYSFLRAQALSKLIKTYSSLDIAHGQVNLPRSGFWDHFSGARTYTGYDQASGKYLERAAVDANGYLNYNKPAIIGESPFGALSPAKGLRLLGATKGGITNPQLIQRAATFADDFVPFAKNAGVTGTLKHQAANRYLHLYQLRNGQRGISTNVYFNNGVGNRGFLDVLDRTNGIIYDFKFGNAVMGGAQRAKYTRNFGLPIEIIKP